MILDFHYMMIMAKITYNNKIVTIDPAFSYFFCFMMSAIGAITIPTMLECQLDHLCWTIYDIIILSYVVLYITVIVNTSIQHT